MMPNKPSRQNGEVAMSKETTDDKAQLYRFLAGAMATVTLMIRDATFMKGMLDNALDLIDDVEKERILDVRSDFRHARILLESVLLDLALIDDDLDPESDDEVSEDDE